MLDDTSYARGSSGHRTIDDPSKGVLRRLWSMLMMCLLAGVVAAGLALPAALAIGVGARNVATGFSSLPQAMEASAVPQRTTVLAANGKPIAYFWKENRTDVELSEISRKMQQAILAIEDYRFYEHGAIDWKGTLRAFLNNAADGSTQGGSSITQQLIKLKLVTAADTKAEAEAATASTYARKLRELRYAMAYERENSKDDILRDYLNIAYYGDAAYGIETAAQHYFSVSADELDASQSALLAGIVKNPTEYNPADNPSTALDRRNVVLARMAELDIITKRRANELAAQGLGLNISSDSNGCLSTVGPFFCSYVRSWLLTQPALGDSKSVRAEAVDTGGLVIRTTLRASFQRAADAAVTARVNPTDQAIGGMAMVEPGTGEVRALSQSRPMGDDKDAGQTYLNYTVPSTYGNANGFQAGSTFKVFTAATALQEGISPFRNYYSPPSLTMQQGSYRDCAGNYPLDWPVGNSTTSGTKNMYTGLSESVNTYFAQLESDAGLCETVSMARSLGIEAPPEDEVGPFTLGVTDTNPLVMASAYATFAARGTYCEPYPVTSVETADGEEVATFEPQCERKMDKSVADRLNDILTLVQQPGGVGYDNGDTGLPVPSAAKTGTTSKSFSVWYMGYTPDLVTSAMIAGANSDGQPQTLTGKSVGGNVVGYASGSGLAGPMWKAAMAKIVDRLPGSEFTEPEPVEPDPFDDGFDDGFGDDFGGLDDDFGDFGATEPTPDAEAPDDDAVTYDYERLAGE
ncbi:MAG TPA: transglycosylase domain-containing protein [Nocardioidaceae bacterium]|nr:transglycosylase domain-containing protein [Nocardioidaceae bacterium]